MKVNMRMIKALEYLRSPQATNRPRLEAHQIEILLALSNIERVKGITMQDLATLTRCGQSQISRNVHAFGTRSLGRRLIDIRVDPIDPRFRIVSLSHDGESVMELFNGILDGTKDQPNNMQKPVDVRVQLKA
jgi:hypothetical protein